MTEKSSTEAGIEEDLIKLLSKIQQKKRDEQKEKGKNFIDVKVENLFDIKDQIKLLNEIKEKNQQDIENHKLKLEKEKKNFETKIEKSQKSLNNLKNR